MTHNKIIKKKKIEQRDLLVDTNLRYNHIIVFIYQHSANNMLFFQVQLN